MATLTLNNLVMTYGDSLTKAVRGVTLEVEQGELLVLLGPSGCGKTTVLRLIAGLESPDEGDIAIDDVSVVNMPPERRNAVLVAQQHALFPFRTVRENVGYGLRLRKVDKAEQATRVDEALRSVQLDGYGDRYPNELSGGQQQRVALARALVVRPQILLLDEPLSSLDPELRTELQQLIRAVQTEACITTVLVTHDRDEAVALADRVAVMADGELTGVGDPSELHTLVSQPTPVTQSTSATPSTASAGHAS